MNWISEHKSEAEFYFNTEKGISSLQQKNFNTHKAFLLELILNIRDISFKYDSSTVNIPTENQYNKIDDNLSDS